MSLTPSLLLWTPIPGTRGQRSPPLAHGPSPAALFLRPPLTSVQAEWLEVDGNVMLLTTQRAGAAFQIIPVAGVLGDPLDLEAAVGAGCELGNGALPNS